MTSLALALIITLLSPAAPMPCPVDGPVEYSHSFGIKHHRGGHRHGGIDVYAEKGTPVVAPERGVVILDESDAGGLTAKLYAGDVTYYFAHLDQHAVDPGAQNMGCAFLVEPGTRIGTVGNSGNAKRTSPHLHFERREDGKRVDPYAQLEASCRT